VYIKDLGLYLGVIGFVDFLFVQVGVGCSIVAIGYISMACLCKWVLVVALWLITMS